MATGIPARVLTVVFGLGMGGTERSAENYSRAYKRRGLDVKVLVTDEAGPRRDRLREQGIDVLLAADHGDCAAAIRDLDAWTPDIVHVHSHGITTKCVDGLRHAFPHALFLETNVFATPQPYHATIDISAQLSSWCEWIYRCRARQRAYHQRVVVLPNLVAEAEFFPDPAARDAFRARYDIALAAFVFCRVGQPHETSWSPVLVDVFRNVHARVSNVRLVLVGASAAVVRRVELLPADVRAAILLLDAQADDIRLRAVYSGSDSFVHIASGGESFGMVLAEAMLCECTPITLSTPAFHNSQCDVVGHGDGGLVCSSIAGFEHAMITLSRDAALRQKLALGGRRRIVDRFTADPVMARLQALISAKPATPPPMSDLVRSCQELYLNAWDRPSPLVCRWLWLRYPLGRVQFLSMGDRLWRAVMKVILRLTALASPRGMSRTTA